MKDYIGSKVKRLRIKKGLSQEQLADNAGLSIRTIQRIENGKTRAIGDTLCKISKVLEISVRELTSTSKQKDIELVFLLNLSGIAVIFHSLAGIISPFIIWIFWGRNHAEVKGLFKRVLIFQSIWLFVLIGTLLIASKGSYIMFDISLLFVITEILIGNDSLTEILVLILYLINLSLISLNVIRIRTNKSILYF